MNDSNLSGSRGGFKKIKEIIKMGGKPNKGTKADKRLKENKEKKREIKPVLKLKSKKEK